MGFIQTPSNNTKAFQLSNVFSLNLIVLYCREGTTFYLNGIYTEGRVHKAWA